MDATPQADSADFAATPDSHHPGADPPVAGALAWATWALFVGLGIMLVGAGLFGTVVGVRSQAFGFAGWQIAAIGTAYYLGFLVGSKLTMTVLGTVGHIRVYAAWTALLSATILVAGLRVGPEVWISTRFVSGVCTAGVYVVAESWLNHLATNDNRGRLLAVYVLVTSGTFGIGQVLVGQFDDRSITVFAVAALLMSIAAIPVTLSEEAAPPPIEISSPLPLRVLARQVPTGIGTCLLVGITHGALIAMGVVYATRSGLSAGEAGRFVAAISVGGMASEWPIAAASDDLDRRFVGVVAALHAVGASVLLLWLGPDGITGLVLMALLGAATYPLYAIASAYTNDWVEPEHASGAASQLMVLYGLGALAGPPLVQVLTAIIGDDGYPWAMIGMHVVIIVFLVYRLFAWRAPITKRPWAQTSWSARAFFIPANLVWFGNRIGRRGRSRLTRKPR